jgi:DNA-binding NarL/FixJ family response regulator
MDRVTITAAARQRARRALAGLSDRERAVVVAIAGGASNAEVAADLHMSVATVKAHVTHILVKLGLDNRTQIALLARDAELT